MVLDCPVTFFFVEGKKVERSDSRGLGHWDRGWPIRMDKQKVKAIEEWGVPVTELRSVLGLLN